MIPPPGRCPRFYVLTFCGRLPDGGMAAPPPVFPQSKNKKGEGRGSDRGDLSKRGPTP